MKHANSANIKILSILPAPPLMRAKIGHDPDTGDIIEDVLYLVFWYEWDGVSMNKSNFDSGICDGCDIAYLTRADIAEGYFLIGDIRNHELV